MTAHLDHVKFLLTAAPGATGALAVGAAPAGEPVVTLGAAHNGLSLGISITEGTAWETRDDCVYNHATRTLSRGTLVASSTGAAVAFTAAAVVSVVLHSAFAGRAEAGGASTLGVPGAFASRALSNEDNGDTLVCATAQTATVNAGLAAGFGAAFKGPIAFSAGAGVTVNDLRSSGATVIWCSLVQIAADQYDVLGGKA